jgi:hypothetical protein
MNCFRYWLLACLVIVGSSACTSRPLQSATSPDGHFKVEITTNDVIPWPTVDVKLQGKTVGRVPDDTHVVFSQITWMPDSKVFGVLVINTVGPDLLLAYDAANNREVDFSIVRKAVGEALLARYSEQAKDDVAAKRDPIKWVREQFRKGGFLQNKSKDSPR